MKEFLRKVDRWASWVGIAVVLAVMSVATAGGIIAFIGAVTR